MTVWEPYLQKLTPDKKDFVLSVLKVAKKYAHGAEESMPYGVPGLRLKGKPIIAVASHANHLGIYPFNPKIVEAIKPEVKNAEFSKGTIRYEFGSLPPDSIIKKIVELGILEIK